MIDPRSSHRLYQEYIIEREGEYPIPVYHSIVALVRGHDLYNIIHTSLFVQSNRDMASQRACSKTTTRWPVMICSGALGSQVAVRLYKQWSMNNIIKVMSPFKGYYTVVYWSRILSLPIYSWYYGECGTKVRESVGVSRRSSRRLAYKSIGN